MGTTNLFGRPILKSSLAKTFIVYLGLLVMVTPSMMAQAATAAASKAVGTVKSITGSELILTTDAGSEATIQIQDSTRMVRTAPGQTTLKDATPTTLQEVQIGDRLLVKGALSTDRKAMVATSAIVMKKSDVSARQQEQREQWKTHGVAGLVKAIVASSGAIDISVDGLGVAKNITVHTTSSTIIRRYPPDSVKFDDAKTATLDQIKPGDQLRARGKRSDDGSEIEAEEIVCGTFRNIAGTISSIDIGRNTVSVMDLITKKTIAVKIGPDSQIKQLPSEFAQRIAMRLKAASADRTDAPTSAPPNVGSHDGRSVPPGGRPGGPPDLQQMLSRLPAATLPDLHKGDAIILVTTEGSANSVPTAITMLSGVEPLLAASSDSSRASTLLSPWSLGSSPGGEANSQ
jgi:hypothetical protein